VTRLNVTTIEELALNAWPAVVVQSVAGWRLRFNWGVTSRANSVWPNEDSGALGLDERLALVEDFYARWGEVARYQICPAARPTGLDDALVERSYSASKPTLVQTTSIAEALARLGSPVHSVTLDERLTAAWFDTYTEALTLYERVGYTTLYGYHYRVASRL
jgi:N-acetylglutamate synthase